MWEGACERQVRVLNMQANVTGPIDDWARVTLRTVEIGVWELTAGACRLSKATQAGKLASLIRSWQSKEGTFCASGMAGIEPTSSKSKDWTPLSP